MANPYLETELKTASPVVLVVRMYEGALRNLRSVQLLGADGDPAARGRHLTKALAILSELRGSLDLEAGGEVAARLDALYAFCMERLVEANLKRDPQGVEDVIPILDNLRGAWAELASRPASALEVAS